MQILSKLDVIRIYADVSESEEIVGFDDFLFKAGSDETCELFVSTFMLSLITF